MTPPIPQRHSESPSDKPLGLLARTAPLFNGNVMGFLALVAFATALGPMVFDVSPEAERALTVVEWMLVSTFVAEFCIQGAVAKDRLKWIKDPWRIVDALTVLGPVVALLPQVSDIASGSLMLRVLRVGRAVAFGTRASSVKVRTRHGADHTTRETKPTVRVIRAAGDLHPVGFDSSSYLAWIQEPGQSWFHASNLSLDDFDELAHAAGVSDQELEQMRREDVTAKLRGGTPYATMVLQIPTVKESDSPQVPQVHRDRLLAVITERNVLTATASSFDLQKSAETQLKAVPPIPFPARVISAILSLVCERNRSVAQLLEAEAHRLDDQDAGRDFLPRSYGLRREITTAAFDLKHLTVVVRALGDGKTLLGGSNLKDDKYIDELLTDTDSLHEAVNRVKEDLEALIELHINKKSFEMNSIVKLLTVVSFLALIPSIAGGLLGMNVAGNPWPVTLGQVAFCVAMVMATALYVFAVKGWLK
jgi:Mg2+ and Co2+ transporter CorA